MKRIRMILFLCFPLLSGIAKGQETVTLAQCYEWARANFPQIRQYGLIGQTEQYNLSNAGKGWLNLVPIRNGLLSGVPAWV